MKKVLILLALIIVAMISYAGTRTIKADKVLAADVTSPSSITWKYTGLAIDSLTANQTSLIYNITVNKAVPMNYYIKVGLDTIKGAEVLATITINGRMFDDEGWTLIETVNTAAVEAEVNTVIESMTDPDFTFSTAAAVDTISQTTITDTDTVLVAARTTTPIVSIKPCWRQIQVVISVNAGNIKAKGIALKDIEWYFQEAK